MVLKKGSLKFAPDASGKKDEVFPTELVKVVLLESEAPPRLEQQQVLKNSKLKLRKRKI